MRTPLVPVALAAAITAAAGAAHAHPGHLAPAAGHSHLLAFAALAGAAALVTVLAIPTLRRLGRRILRRRAPR